MKAVIWTDVFQSVIILLGLIFVLVAVSARYLQQLRLCDDDVAFKQGL
jgi:Na+/proline symporter